MQWSLDSNRRYIRALYSQAQYPYNEFVHSIPSYFSKCIITTIRLSGLSWRTKTTFAPIASRLTALVLSIHVILRPSVFYNRTSYSFASTISTCCSSWAWDHDCHITPTIYHVSVGAPSSLFVYRMR